LTAISISASSKTMNGALPPSSIEVFLTVAAHCSISNLPTSVEPVKVNLRTVGLRVSSPPISFDGRVTQEKTPFGTSARSANSHKAKAENGVAVAGFNTIVQTAAKAGPALRIIIATEKFHGVIAAHAPIGSLEYPTDGPDWPGQTVGPKAAAASRAIITGIRRPRPALAPQIEGDGLRLARVLVFNPIASPRKSAEETKDEGRTTRPRSEIGLPQSGRYEMVSF
jgi:hypothetical protein